MSILDSVKKLLGAGGSEEMNLESIASQVGLDSEQVEKILSALGQFQGEDGDTAESAANATGIPIDKVQAVLSQIGGEGALGNLSQMLGGLGRNT